MANNPFLEEQLPVSIKMGATYGDEYEVEITQTKSGGEYRRLIHPFPVRHYNLGYIAMNSDLWAKVLSLYHRAYGMFAGFRVKAMDDFSTNGNTGVPTATDQTMLLVSAGVYQLQKAYGSGGTPLPIGLPVRTIYKPVNGTVKVGVSGATIASTGYSVDNTTGLVTFNTNKTASVTGITKAAAAVISCAGHTFVAGEYVYLSGITVGMTQINAKRLLINSVSAGVSITVAINSTAFSTWSAGGVLNTRPQTGEAVTAGCYFDLPFRFNSRIDITHLSSDVRDAPNIDIVELIAL